MARSKPLVPVRIEAPIHTSSGAYQTDDSVRHAPLAVDLLGRFTRRLGRERRDRTTRARGSSSTRQPGTNCRRRTTRVVISNLAPPAMPGSCDLRNQDTASTARRRNEELGRSTERAVHVFDHACEVHEDAPIAQDPAVREAHACDAAASRQYYALGDH